jgi:hypothetical protein
MSKMYHPLTLLWKDAEMELKFRQAKYDLFFTPLVLYCIVDAGFSVYLMVLDTKNIYEWQKHSA